MYLVSLTNVFIRVRDLPIQTSFLGLRLWVCLEHNQCKVPLGTAWPVECSDQVFSAPFWLLQHDSFVFNLKEKIARDLEVSLSGSPSFSQEMKPR